MPNTDRREERQRSSKQLPWNYNLSVQLLGIAEPIQLFTLVWCSLPSIDGVEGCAVQEQELGTVCDHPSANSWGQPQDPCPAQQTPSILNYTSPHISFPPPGKPRYPKPKHRQCRQCQTS